MIIVTQEKRAQKRKSPHHRSDEGFNFREFEERGS